MVSVAALVQSLTVPVPWFIPTMPPWYQVSDWMSWMVTVAATWQLLTVP